MTGAAVLSRFRSFDGAEIAYLDEGAGPLVVLLHGLGSDHRENWVDPGVVATLTAAGHRVVAPDSRGHGQSAKPHDQAAYGEDALVHDARALLDHLGVTEPGAVDVVGYSMGAIVASRWVPTDDRCRSVLLAGVGDHIADGSRSTITGVVGTALLADDPATLAFAPLREIRESLLAKGNDRLALAALDLAGVDDPSPEHLAGLGAVPTEVLAGDRDDFVGSPTDLAARIPGATARTVPGDHLTAVVSAEFPVTVAEFVASTHREDARP